MSVPMVSVLVITYNHEEYIKQAIQSILDQKTDFPVELIIGEDCSMDSTLQICLWFQNKYPDRIQVLYSEKNVGHLENKKRCLRNAHGKYIAFLDGDDFWTDELKLQKQINFLEQNNEYGLVHTDVNHLLQESGNLIRDYDKTNHINIPSGNIFVHLLGNDSIIKIQTVCCRKVLLTSNQAYELAAERKWPLTDLALWLEIAWKSKIQYFPETTATYRIIENSASNQSDLGKRLRFHRAIYDIKLFFAEKYNVDNEVRKNILARSYLVLLYDAYKMKDFILVGKTGREIKEKHIKINYKGHFIIRYVKFFNIGNSIRKIIRKTIRNIVTGFRKRSKTDYEIEYWITLNKANGFLNSHYEYFFTTHFGLNKEFYCNKKILDIGCGPMGSLEWADKSAERIGIDPLAEKYRQLGTYKHKMKYVCGSGEQIPFPENYFDVVSSFNSLDTIDNLEISVSEIARVLKKDGLFLLLAETHEPVPAQPISFSFNVTEKFKSNFHIAIEKDYEKKSNGIYESIWENIPFDHANKAKRYGIISAKFIKQ